MHPSFASWLIRQLAPALADLHAQGLGVAHGALTADRIVLTPDRRLVIVEHVLGSALEEQGFSAERLWREFGIIAVPTVDTAPRLDSRSDIVQLGLIALSILLGRRVTPEEYPSKLEPLLDEMAESAGRRSPAVVGPLRQWLERALQVEKGFRSALEASRAVPERALTDFTRPSERPSIDAAPALEIPQSSPVQETAVPETPMTPMALTSSAESSEAIHSDPARWDDVPAARRFSMVRNIAIGLAALALVEAVVIGRLMTKPAPAPVEKAPVPVTIDSPSAGDSVIVDGRQAGVTPLQLNIGPAVHSIRVIGRESTPPPLAESAPVAPPAANDPRTASARALALAAQRQLSGGLRLSSPIELQVLEGERVLGSSADGPIVASAGTHQLDFINTEFGYRSRQTVDIKAGQILPLKVQPPDGRVSINAQPWAQVWIDGNLVGETPLANLSVPVGEHEITFRHPQLGERKETTIVKSGTQTRISASLTK